MTPAYTSYARKSIRGFVLPCITCVCWCHQTLTVSRAAERIIGPWRSFNFGPLAYLSLYILCHVMLHEKLSFVIKGGLGVLPQKKMFKILENGAILCILVAQNGL